VKVNPDLWLAETIGRPAFRVTADGHSPLTPSLAAGFYYAKIPTADVASVMSLGCLGFSVVDVNVTLECSTPRETKLAPSPVRVREHRDEDAPAALEIADTSFVFSRFHLDPNFPKHMANRIKREWVASYVRGDRGDRLLVAELDGQVAGFLAALVSTDDRSSVGTIDLIGVSPMFQRRGVGRCLVTEFLRVYSDKTKLRVGTQVANAPSIRLYEQCGFRFAESAYVLHAHIMQGRDFSS